MNDPGGTLQVVSLAILTGTMVVGLVGLWIAIKKQRADSHQRFEQMRVDNAERMTKLETKLDIMFNFWERTLERRSRNDQEKWQAAHGGTEQP